MLRTGEKHLGRGENVYKIPGIGKSLMCVRKKGQHGWNIMNEADTDRRWGSRGSEGQIFGVMILQYNEFKCHSRYN